MINFAVRPFTPADYGGIAAIETAVAPEFPETAQSLQDHDAQHDPDLVWNRLVADDNGRIIGAGLYTQANPWSNPRQFFFHVGVVSDRQGQGVGKALYEHLQNALAPHQPTQLRVLVREQSRAVRFCHERGFREKMREHQSRLEPAHFQPEAWADALSRVQNEGIVIRTIAEFQDQLPHFLERLEELHWRVAQDIPQPDPPTRPPFSEWRKRFDRPGFLPDGNFYAFDGENVVGITVLWGNTSNHDLFTGSTGVLPEFRKRGIATALKVRALLFAKQRGATAVYTTNEVHNTGMLGINARLGFVPQPAWLHMAKDIKAA